jgi:excisionase family DNA binding protein
VYTLATQVRQELEERENRLLTVAEVAAYFRVDPESVRRWLRDGKLLGINLGRGPGWRIRFADLQSFIDQRRTKTGDRTREAADENEESAETG